MTPEQLLKEADRCVKCGLCLPHCPTYLLLENEADSPRGRISLIQALASGELRAERHLEIHLERCLSCRACETACPSGVKYGQLIDGGRLLLNHRHHKRPGWRRLFDLLSDRRRLERWWPLYPIMQRTGMTWLAARLPSQHLRRLLAMARQLPSGRTRQGGLHPARMPSGRSVQLFVGCVGSRADRRLIDCTLHLLTSLGYAVEIPDSQACCGALHRHNGFPEKAEQLCESNRRQLEKSRAESLVTLASACHLELTEHLQGRLPVISLVDFLLGLPETALAGLQPLERRVALHIPCTGRNDRSRALLGRIPGIDLVELPDNAVCCGAAGSYLLTQPALSVRLGEDKIERLRRVQAQILVTGNTGCALQFRQLIGEAGLDVEVMHPAELIARQLGIDNVA